MPTQKELLETIGKLITQAIAEAQLAQRKGALSIGAETIYTEPLLIARQAIADARAMLG